MSDPKDLEARLLRVAEILGQLAKDLTPADIDIEKVRTRKAELEARLWETPPKKTVVDLSGKTGDELLRAYAAIPDGHVVMCEPSQMKEIERAHASAKAPTGMPIGPVVASKLAAKIPDVPPKPRWELESLTLEGQKYIPAPTKPGLRQGLCQARYGVGDGWSAISIDQQAFKHYCPACAPRLRGESTTGVRIYQEIPSVLGNPGHTVYCNWCSLAGRTT